MSGFDSLAGFKPDAMVITREKVLHVFRKWEDLVQSGECLSSDEMLYKSADELAEERTEEFINLLREV